MRKLLTISVVVLISATVWAQAPQKMSYQAVIRDGGGVLVSSHEVGMQISILQGAASGTSVYVETQTPTTNENGLVSIEIGNGTVQSGDFSTINWASGLYFIKTETDPAGGTNYTITGTSQLLSVPYALHAKTAETVLGGINETDPIFGVSPANGITSNDIANWNDKLSLEADGSVTNEIQALRISRDTIYLSSGGFVKLPAGFDGDYNSLINKPVGISIGDMQYWNGITWINVPVGQPGQFLQINASHIPTWSGTIPAVTTTGVTSITGANASGGGNITSLGGGILIESGICWGTSPNPTINDNKSADGSFTGLYTCLMSGLTTGTIYHVRAYAINGVGIGYGNEVSFIAVAIGDSYQGGKIAYILKSGDPGYDPNVPHGLIATPSDANTGGGEWGCEGIAITGADGSAIGTGSQNTIDIVNGCSTAGTAARLCYDLVLNGYSDWYLPSKEELIILLQNRDAIGGFNPVNYWSSTECDASNAWMHGNSGWCGGKSTPTNARAIRSF